MPAPATDETSLARAAPSNALADPTAVVRQTVRALLLSSPAFLELDPPRRRELASAMVTVCSRAASLLKEEAESDRAAATALASTAPSPTSAPAHRPPPFARAQNAGEEYSGVSAERVAGTTRAILNAVSFPRFVTELINGVFKAMVDSNQQQMHAFVELLNNVSASTEGFEGANLGPDRARAWLVEQYPGSFELAGDDAKDAAPDEPREVVLRRRPGAAMPPEGALRVNLGLRDDESVPTGDPDRTLVPLARRVLARKQQQVLATMVMLGLQRIVIESGRINASMRFHIDTRSAAQQDKGSRFDVQNKLEAAGSYGFGPWGVSAKMTNTIGYVSTQKTQSTEEMKTDLDLNSSVELVFKTDYVPLDRLAGAPQVDRIRVNTLNPEAEARAAAEVRGANERRIAESDAARRSSLDAGLAPSPISSAPSATTPPTKSGSTPGSQPAATTPVSTPGSTPGRQPTAAPAQPATPQSLPALPPSSSSQTSGTAGGSPAGGAARTQ